MTALLLAAGCATVVAPEMPAPVSASGDATGPATVERSPAAHAPTGAAGPIAAPVPAVAPVAAPTPAPAAATSPATAAQTAAVPQRDASVQPVDPIAALAPPTGRPPQPAAGTVSLWERIRAGFAMPALDSPLVARQERFYLERPDYLQRMFSRGSRYLFHIVEEIEKRGMPTELALLPFVESAMNPVALSHARASGLWQFIPSTGRAYNLQQDWWVDNRRDVVKSTEAALDYLQKIYAMHGNDWFLALASYNWGEGAVARAVRQNKARGRPTDYLSLKMPAETRNYVPKLMAMKNIMLRARELGVALPELPNRPYFVTIEKTRPIDLKLAARFAGMTVDEFVALNPAHNRPVIAASRNNLIKLPTDRLDEFMLAVERHGQSNHAFATWQPHTIKAGETLETLAQRGGVGVAELREANGLRNGQRILPGTHILVPQRAVDDETRVERFAGARVYELVERPAAYHRVGRRETLTSIARRYQTSVANLRIWNSLTKNEAVAGTRLLVRPAVSQTVLTNENGVQRVVRNEVEQPRMVRAVMRRAPADAPASTRATSAPPSAEGKAARRTSSARKAATARSRPDAKTTRAAARRDTGRIEENKSAARRADKRT
ncbi:MAG: transglycosylase SLT domain-containing protein [Burkholderiaceae bacterium]|nr:transglycosylase SLT domain-containing protein [Burkholderiaceae bacterium]